MLIDTKLNTFSALVSEATHEELLWMNGYISGIVSVNKKHHISEDKNQPVGKITIVYGTESGNAKKLATTFAAKAKKNGIIPKVSSLDQYKVAELAKEEYLFIIISTQGDGEPPASAQKFYDHLFSINDGLKHIKYAVLALGDTAYPLFCKAGEDVDVRMQLLGAQRAITLQKCDTDYSTQAEEWFDNALRYLRNVNDGVVAVADTSILPKTTSKKGYSGTILNNINLNDTGSNKKTHHIEIAAEHISYAPGDSIGLIPENPMELVQAVFEATGFETDTHVVHKGIEQPVFDLLRKNLNISFLPERTIRKYSEIIAQEIPSTKIGLHQLLKIYPVKDAQQFEKVINILEPITPRLYSISSAVNAYPDEVHITVGRDQFFIDRETQFGLCSNFLCQSANDSKIDFYIHKNEQFRLPEQDKDIIMIGPGTGIAPFRAFLQEREATGATGKNWLFFGDQHFTTDFLYQTEIQNWIDTGLLTKVNTAFSRDQNEKVYVQHKMLANGEELFQWLQAGAYLYICGAKEPMSVDVLDALQQIIVKHGQYSHQSASDFLAQLTEEGKLLKDVY